MVAPRLKSRSKKRRQVSVTKGTREIYKKRKAAKPKCSICGKPLHGMARVRSTVLSRISKSKKRPERLYGGSLCSPCSRKKIKESIKK